MEHFLMISIIEWWRTIYHLIDKDAKSPPVSRISLAFIHDNLRTDIIGSSSQGISLLSFFKKLAQPIVRHLYVAVGLKENILWLQVSVDIAQIMKVLDSQENLSSIELSFFLMKLLGFSEMCEHFSSPDKVHDKEYLLLRLESILQGNQKGMLGFFQQYSFSSSFLQMLFLYQIFLPHRFYSIILFIFIVHTEHYFPKSPPS